MAHNLEQDSEDNEAEVGVADQFPREAVQEANLIGHDGRWARLLAERACTVLVISVAEKRAIGRYRILTRHSFRVQLTWRDALFRSEVDVRFTIHGAIVAQEVQEGDRTADTGCSDERSNLARSVDSAGVVCVNANLNVSVVVVHIDSLG